LKTVPFSRKGTKIQERLVPKNYLGRAIVSRENGTLRVNTKIKEEPLDPFAHNFIINIRNEIDIKTEPGEAFTITPWCA
jgi:hypothetical protein